jgi:hypothetical protein
LWQYRSEELHDEGASICLGTGHGGSAKEPTSERRPARLNGVLSQEGLRRPIDLQDALHLEDVTSLCLLSRCRVNYLEQEIEMECDVQYGADVPIQISSALLRHLNETARPCVRMAIEGASASAGAPPQWLERASDIRTRGFEHRHGRTLLHVKAPTLGEAAPELFAQQKLWPGVASPEDTALQLIGKVSCVIRQQEAASDMYDQPLLKRISHWNTLFHRNVHRIEMPAAHGSATLTSGTLDLKVVENARLLSDQVPAPRQVRVVGKLDMVRHSTRSFGLLLENGEEVRGVLQEGDPALLLAYFGRTINVFGKAVYRPSGSLLRIDAQELVDSAEGKSAFGSIPAALSSKPRPDKRLQNTKAGVGAFFGTWPGDETDEELLAALAEIRR